MAKSFALREAPSGVGVHTSKQKALEKKQKLDDERKAATGYSSYKRKSDAILRACADEFGDGNVRKLARLGSALTVREKSGIKQPIVDKDFKSGANKIVVKSRSMVGNVFNGKRTTFK